VVACYAAASFEFISTTLALSYWARRLRREPTGCVSPILAPGIALTAIQSEARNLLQKPGNSSYEWLRKWGQINKTPNLRFHNSGDVPKFSRFR
jgi:hypothetical protein